MVNAIITAGGTSSRFGEENKLLVEINGKDVISHTVEAFLKTEVAQIIICANLSILDLLREKFRAEPRIVVIEGGSARQQSVFNGLKYSKTDYVLIHDAARPMVTPELINTCIAKVKEVKALSVMTKTVDTIKEVVDGKIVRTIDRTYLYNTQTPQAFEYDLILSAHEKYKHQSFTDDAALVEEFGVPVHIVEGSYKNIKITTKSDVALAQIYLENNC